MPYNEKVLHDLRVDGSDSRDITLVTAHASQGRQWSHVWVVDVADRIVPGRMFRPDTHIFHVEQRLFYVLATRSAMSLQFWYCSDHGRDSPTCFLRPGKHLLERSRISA